MSNFFIDHYLQHSLRHEIRELYMTIAIKNFAFSMITIFEPIYLYNLYHSIPLVFLYYGMIYTLYVIALPLGGKAAARYGFEHCIFYSIPFAILYFLSLSQLPNNNWLMPVAILLCVTYKTLFWPSYHTDFAHYSKIGYKGREMSALSMVSTIATMLGPLVGGIVIAKFGFEVLFVFVSLISLISVLPLFATIEKFEPHNFSYWKAFKRIASPYGKYRRKDSLAYFGYGEEVIITTGWSVFVFLIIEKFYLMGILASTEVFIIAFITLYVGKLSDTLNSQSKKRLLDLSTIFYAISWFLGPFVGNWLGILMIDILSMITKLGINYPLYTFVYNGGGDDHKGFLKYMVFYEMSLSIGKMTLAWIAFLLSLTIGGFLFWFILFSLTGFWSFLYLYSKP